ncbi:MAG TPA: hypothetical protein VM884_01500 [Flavisolibacter sp.]|nr:hypothetical protein [Flavisolibacter sp.]
MHDSFEKEVQRKMEEMQLTPSAPVWEKIEVEIKGKKKRRRGVFWLLLAGLLLAGGGWWGYQSLHKDHLQASMQTEIRTKKSNPDTSASTQTYPHSPDPTDAAAKAIALEPIVRLTKKLKRYPAPAAVKKPTRFEGVTAEVAEPKNVRTVTSRDQTGTSLIKEDKKRGAEANGSKSKEMITSISETTPSTKNTDTPGVAKEQIPVITDSAPKPTISKEQVLPAAIDSSLKKKVAAASKAWKKQLSISIGRSSYQNYSTAVNQLNYSSPITGAGSNGNFAFYYPRPASAGFGFSTGLALLKQLGKKWELGVGLQYAYYSTQISVGDKKAMDTAVTFNMEKIAVDEFFTNTGNNNYINRFHVLEIPIRFSYQPLSTLPVFLSAGASYGRLVSTNALTYSRPSNLYYKNKENYNRNYLSVNASVQYRFKSKKRFSIQTGPLVQYNLKRLQKEDITNIPHLFFAGLKTDIRF